MDSKWVAADVDLERVSRERMKQNTFGQSVERHRDELTAFRTVRFGSVRQPAAALPLLRRVPRFPYVPADSAERDERCEEVFNIQVQGLVQRLQAEPHRARPSSASRAGSTRRMRCSSSPARWTCSACRAATSWPTPCRPSPPARARSTRRGG